MPNNVEIVAKVSEEKAVRRIEPLMQEIAGKAYFSPPEITEVVNVLLLPIVKKIEEIVDAVNELIR